MEKPVSQRKGRKANTGERDEILTVLLQFQLNKSYLSTMVFGHFF